MAHANADLLPDRAAESRVRLAALVARFAEGDGPNETAIGPLRLVRYAHPTGPIHVQQDAALWIVAQGRKALTLADETFAHGPDEGLLVSFDLPVVTCVVEASPQAPFFGVALALNPAEMAATLAGRASREAGGGPGLDRAVSVQPVTGDLLDAVGRLVGLLDRREDVRALAPLVLEEVRYRLLVGPHGALARQLARADPRAEAVARAIAWLREHHAERYALAALTREVGMSASALHRHFKAATGLTPLQYHKEIRLREARALMLGEGLTAAAAGHRVGYASPAQFSREYRRAFGAPPGRDVVDLRAGRGRAG